MEHIPIIRAVNTDSLLEFSHFNKDAQAGAWKKEKMIMLDSIKINVFIEGSFSVFSDNALHRPVYGDICVFLSHDSSQLNEFSRTI